MESSEGNCTMVKKVTSESRHLTISKTTQDSAPICKHLWSLRQPNEVKGFEKSARYRSRRLGMYGTHGASSLIAY